ncbi:MAG: alpha/beta fold hydrolase [Acidobacteria bacterium]|nr:alpha/beta fold hydrolase [Acidobacteriota bacterium]MBI3655405.1 alpha/beta fold hydrolase [Acidobacteriota bacterium]
MAEWSEQIRQILAGRAPSPSPAPADDVSLVRAAVLIPLYECEGQIYVLLTRRTDKVDHHKGQVSFPGGRYDDSDQNSLNTALREAYEEVGLQPADIKILGVLDSMLTSTGFVVTPYVGMIPYPYKFHLNEDEVAAALHVPLAVFQDPSHFREEIWEWNGEFIPMQFYRHQEEVIWGATARIMKSFLEVVGDEAIAWPLATPVPARAGKLQLGSQRGFHYVEWGSAGRPCLVLLHGALQTAHSWDDLAAVLQDRYRLLALDQRGHGESDWADSYRLDDYVMDLEAFLDHWQIGPVALIGMSMGGLNAMVYAVRRPSQVKGLVLMDAGPGLCEEGVRTLRDFAKSVPDEFSSLEEAVELARLFNPRRSIQNLRHRLFHNLRRRVDGKWVWRYDPQFKQFGSAYSEPLPDLWPVWAQVTSPTLIVRGQESNVLTQAVAHRMTEGCSRVVLAEVAGAGHAVVGDNLEGCLAALEPFLANL